MNKINMIRSDIVFFKQIDIRFFIAWGQGYVPQMSGNISYYLQI